MTINLEPNSKGWELIRDDENLLLYTNKELGLSVILSKFEGRWIPEYTNGNFSIKLNTPCDKSTAIARARKCMRENPTLPEMIPVLKPGESPVLRAKKFVNLKTSDQLFKV